MKLEPVSQPFFFELLGRCAHSRARRGRFITPHGSAETPAFMPVGTAATIKSLDPSQVAATGSQVLLCNTYHLTLRPGEEVVRALGGLHTFMRWNGPILTDSGGYQVFSLADLTRIDGDGVTFKSHLDGTELRLTPERAMQIQLDLGSDILMVLDECLPTEAGRDMVLRSVMERTLPWGERCLDVRPRDGRAVFAIGQGQLFPDVREIHAQAIREQAFDGYAIGGLSVGERPEQLREMIEISTAILPESRPRYLMGVGSVPEILDSVARGVDMFDCVLPSRNARNGQALTFDGHLRLKNARYRKDPGVLDPECPCATCRGGFSRAYLRHLIMAGELLAASLMTLHNLTFMQRLMGKLRSAIDDSKFDSWHEHTVSRWNRGANQSPVA